MQLKKAIDDAFKNLVKIEGIHGNTINHDVQAKYNASKILLKPASEGTGLIAGGAVRPVLELVGIKDILSKSLGSNEPHNLVRATVEALKMIKSKKA
jgi:small subunit ribosomal protein S5